MHRQRSGGRRKRTAVIAALDVADRFAQVHAFDIEVSAALFLYVDVGYSPGETLDFLLGIFGIDIAKDDGKSRSR